MGLPVTPVKLHEIGKGELVIPKIGDWWVRGLLPAARGVTLFSMNTSGRASPSRSTETRPPRTALPPMGTAIVVTVRAVSAREGMIRVDGPQGEHYLLNKRVMGTLWGRVHKGEKLELRAELDPGKPTKILSVHLAAA